MIEKIFSPFPKIIGNGPINITSASFVLGFVLAVEMAIDKKKYKPDNG